MTVRTGDIGAPSRLRTRPLQEKWHACAAFLIIYLSNYAKKRFFFFEQVDDETAILPAGSPTPRANLRNNEIQASSFEILFKSIKKRTNEALPAPKASEQRV